MEPKDFQVSATTFALVLYFLIFAVIFTVVSGIGGVYDWAQRKLSKSLVCQHCAKGPDGDKQENKQD